MNKHQLANKCRITFLQLLLWTYAYFQRHFLLEHMEYHLSFFNSILIFLEISITCHSGRWLVSSTFYGNLLLWWPFKKMKEHIFIEEEILNKRPWSKSVKQNFWVHVSVGSPLCPIILASSMVTTHNVLWKHNW